MADNTGNEGQDTKEGGEEEEIHCALGWAQKIVDADDDMASITSDSGDLADAIDELRTAEEEYDQAIDDLEDGEELDDALEETCQDAAVDLSNAALELICMFEEMIENAKLVRKLLATEYDLVDEDHEDAYTGEGEGG